MSDRTNGMHHSMVVCRCGAPLQTRPTADHPNGWEYVCGWCEVERLRAELAEARATIAALELATLDGMAWWEKHDPEHADTNWGRTCVCGRAVPAGSRYAHDCEAMRAAEPCPACRGRTSRTRGLPCALCGADHE